MMDKFHKTGMVFPLMLSLCLFASSLCLAQVESEKCPNEPILSNTSTSLRGMDGAWDVLGSFTTHNPGQQGIASDGNYIYTCSWKASPTGGYSFHKYDLEGNYIEGFNIEGVGEIRDLTYDGQYFYGGTCATNLYTIDLANKVLIGSVNTTCSCIRHCSYDPDNDGFWVGDWASLKLISRTGQTMLTAPAPTSAYGSGYYKDVNNQAHLYLFCQPDENALVYDYVISTNNMGTTPVFDFSTVPGFDATNGISGGAFVGEYNGKMAFFGNVQQNPNLVAILELGSTLPPPTGTSTVVLTAGDVWGDGTGYQMLLDANANTYGSVIPTSGGLTQSGDASPEVYAQFEYKIPVDADGAMNTQNIVFNNSVAIQIPSGIYDWCITNPTPNDRIWIAGSNGNIGGRQNDYTFEPNKTYEFVVTLQGQNDAVNVSITENMSYEITTSVVPANSGMVSGGRVYQQGSTCTLTASANSGYSFEKWTKDGVTVSIESPYVFTVTENASYEAHFTPVPVSCTITTLSDPAEGGTTSGGGIYNANSPCTIVATPNPGYRFVKWTKGQGDVSDQPVHNFIVTSNATYVAHFQQTFSHGFMISASADPFVGGSVSGGGEFSAGEICTLSATPNTNYEFENWTKDGVQVSTEATFSFEVVENAHYIAHFRQSVTGYTVTVSANPSNGGTVSGGGTFAAGIECTVSALANEGYKFTNWTENGVIQWLTDQYGFVVDRDRTLVANFEALPAFTISAMAGPNGSISPQGDVQVFQGGEVTFNITAGFGARIKQVLIDGLDIGPVDTYTFTNVNRDHTIYAMFSGLDVDENQNNAIQVYPNPSDEEFVVVGDEISIIRVYNMLGCKLYDAEVTSNCVVVATGNLPAGTYLVEVSSTNGTKRFERLVVTH